ncbi:hypothetical protein PILCRDRAFT_814463 [Piloderma croceum F 1598]|uniref:Uncharacterized protein n=1 Tax=Piloderma croceum (strain F 1598) TaxID=765440 RepID=A0A0C3BMP9_PILCF|nr:hypothetical protein PILCRDRAFT_814463 [Piloderma croceum F 1598]
MSTKKSAIAVTMHITQPVMRSIISITASPIQKKRLSMQEIIIPIAGCEYGACSKTKTKTALFMSVTSYLRRHCGNRRFLDSYVTKDDVMKIWEVVAYQSRIKTYV